jgi:predicted O-methyltransferase YrrM
MINANLAPGQDNYTRWSINIKPHWTPGYLWSRYKEYLFRKKNPDNPWLTQDAISIIGSMMLPTDNVLEFGSGRSTIWFAKRASKVISVENHADWYKAVEQMLKSLNWKVDYHLVADGENQEARYRELLSTIPSESIDICLVDGGPRALCAVESVSKVKKGGFVIIDNVNWFLPSDSKSPSSLRSLDQCHDQFRHFYEMVKGWRVIWTSNGVTDTALYIKPW